MGRLLLLFAFVGCSSSSVAIDGGGVELGVDAATDAGTFDTSVGVDAGSDLGAPPFDGGGALALSLADPMLQSCRCHHGCGAGIDGTIALDVTNASAASHVLLVMSVTLTPIGSPGGPFVVPGGGYFRVTGAAADGSVTVAGGVTASIVVMVYVDFSSPPFAAMPGTYRVDVALDVDGVASTLTLDAASVTLGAGCGP